MALRSFLRKGSGPGLVVPSVGKWKGRGGASSLRASGKKQESAIDDVSVILLAGGVGSRMKADRPKQFLELEGKPILRHSLELFMKIQGVTRIVIVIAPEYRDSLADVTKKDARICFAEPGKERQDSVFNGLQETALDTSLICIHDAARPLVTEQEILSCMNDALEHGAAVLAVPMKATVKESEDGKFVLRTIERSRLWEIHTPQVREKEQIIRPALLREGFKKVKELNLAVTDDVSIIEQLPAPVKITVGEYTNIKITTPEDMPMARSIL
ncbi:2-C-methyl-D-erythritol 4-phosphate cytidylyltransferase [Guillardia theta CCMP2712]|uniref:2-C-methyl-D-erythritol 4-phosphate cytidylyltransferase, chloroplastic n=1 Tax=Guillardia theta (strain CCMP2712) TaxID=905079 RepID=L1IBN8_GUITC|nr:2-C-methyl-D-erythritol 4-phosphate cytidylyltransferase [Guillardia theta CCMP2712]EKX33502.1 2-C-methyl-D-erythritol 4-phosphate cytidylyltransferase [Guillardia theta CCMP2712]|eukprot:XP_005820482.1 2-C-methyl-D-erythritol 4-phosphate cytidylyltransferase [Guillardia theta CCMP2712]